MKFNAATVVLVAVCLVAAVGSQIQAKILVNLFNTPILVAWIVSMFLLLVGVVQWISRKHPEITKNQPESSLLLIVLQIADITTFFIAINYNSVAIIASLQLIVLNLWQLLYASETKRAYTVASYVFCFGVMAFFLQELDPENIQWSLFETASATIYACINHYVHHYVQRWIGDSQFLLSEIYASGSIVVLMAPFAWLEFSTIKLEDVNVSYTTVTVVLLCGLLLGYRRAGIFLNTLTHSETAKLFIATTFLTVLITGFNVTSPLTAVSLILMAVSAYVSSLEKQQEGGSESRGKIYFLLALCTALLLFQCTMTIVTYSNHVNAAVIEEVPTTKSIQLDPEFEFNRLICLRKVRERLFHEIDSRIIDGKPFAFMDLPMHWNLGDVFIWQGTQTILEARGQFPLVTDLKEDKNVTVAKALLANGGVALLQGGGNFGDLWRGSANFRNQAVKEINTADIIFLSQSLNYSRVAAVKFDNTTFQSNNRTLFMFRDYPSLQYSLTKFPGKRAMYVPDTAFAMGPQTPVAKPIVDVIFLLRLDKERLAHQRVKSFAILEAANITYEVWDFPVAGFPLKLEKNNKTIYNYTQILPKQLLTLPQTYRQASLGIRTQLANTLFSRSRLVITDRLHASIMSTLMGKPLIYLDNTYRKITNVRGALAQEFSECTDQNLHARHTATLVEAVELAVKIFNGTEIM